MRGGRVASFLQAYGGTIGKAVILVVAVCLFVEMLRPHELSIDVAGLTWSRTIGIESWATVEDRTWRRYSIPSSARVTDERREFYGWEEDDDGDDHAVYKTRYYYEYETWLHARDVVTSGTYEVEPYWGDVILSGPTGPHDTGRERESGREETFFVSGGDGRLYRAPRDLWESLRIGDRRILTVHFDGRLEDNRR